MQWEPKNLTEARFPFFTTNALIGHGIFRWPAGQQRPVFSVIYAVILTSLYLTVLYYTLITMSGEPWYGDYEKILLLLVYVNVGTFIFQVLLSWCNAKRFSRVTEDLTKVDETLQELGATFNYARTKNEGYALILIWIIMMTGFNWFDVLWHFDARPISRIFLIFSVLHYPAHVATIVATNFSMDVRHVHLKLGAISKDLCVSYGMQLVLNVTSLFVTLTGFLYLLYNMAINPMVFSQNLRMVALGVWVTFYFAHFVIINEVCERVCAEAHRTGEIIHCISQEIEDTELANEISQFSLQLINDPAEFSPAGFISLGHRFVLSFVETVTTYLAILIQMSPPKAEDIKP